MDITETVNVRSIFFDSVEIWIFEMFLEKWKSPDGSFFVPIYFALFVL
jgi:hypothetical protein